MAAVVSTSSTLLVSTARTGNRSLAQAAQIFSPHPQWEEIPMNSLNEELKEEGAAFFWFNSRTISDAGHSMYGRFVYQQFLPSLAPAKQRDPESWFVLCDGDCMTDSGGLKGYFRPQDGRLLDEVKRIGDSLCYVVAVLGQGTRTWEDIDRELRQAKALGYLGVSVPARFSRETFLRARQIMALVIAARIDGAKFKKISYEYQTDAELSRLGFQPYVESR
jgi:hypothetical protein